MSSVPVTFTTLIEHELALLEDRLIDALPHHNMVLAEHLRNIILAGGKRLRPSLTIFAGRIFKADSERVISLAAGIELLHTATLIHDDLVDNARARRSQPTLNSVFPPGLVILTGDLMFAEAARLVAEADHIGVVHDFARCLSEICNGELLQAQSKHTLVSPKAYYERIYGKTASLFKTAAGGGAMMGTDIPSEVKALSEYGRLLGMAFQIVDDALDFISSSAQLGKPSGHDLREGVLSLPVILYSQKMQHENGSGTFKRVIAGKASEDQVLEVIEQIRASGAINDTLAVAEDFAQQARNALMSVHTCIERDILMDLTHFTVERSY